MTKVTIELPARTLLKTVNGEAHYIDWSKVPETVLPAIIEGATKIVMNNAFNSGGKDKPEVERLAQMLKRRDAWYRGEYAIAERGESAYTGLWNAYVDDMRDKTGCSAADVEGIKRETVRAAFGEKAKATTALFFQALAQAIAEENGTEPADEQEAIEGHYGKIAELAAQRRAKTMAKVDVKGLALAQFRKAK